MKIKCDPPCGYYVTDPLGGLWFYDDFPRKACQWVAQGVSTEVIPLDSAGAAAPEENSA